MGRAFSAGGDCGPGEAISSNPNSPNMMVEARQIVDHTLECDKPIIAAVKGYAMGLGATWHCYATLPSRRGFTGYSFLFLD